MNAAAKSTPTITGVSGAIVWPNWEWMGLGDGWRTNNPNEPVNEMNGIKFTVDFGTGGTLCTHYTDFARDEYMLQTIHNPFKIRIWSAGQVYIRWQVGDSMMPSLANFQTILDRCDGEEITHGVDDNKFIDYRTFNKDFGYAEARQLGTGWIVPSGASWRQWSDSPVGEEFSEFSNPNIALVTILGSVTRIQVTDAASKSMIRTLYSMNIEGYQGPGIGGSYWDPGTWYQDAAAKGEFAGCTNLRIANGCLFPSSFVVANGTFLGCQGVAADLGNIRWPGVQQMFYTFADTSIANLPSSAWIPLRGRNQYQYPVRYADPSYEGGGLSDEWLSSATGLKILWNALPTITSETSVRQVEVPSSVKVVVEPNAWRALSIGDPRSTWAWKSECNMDSSTGQPVTWAEATEYSNSLKTLTSPHRWSDYRTGGFVCQKTAVDFPFAMTIEGQPFLEYFQNSNLYGLTYGIEGGMYPIRTANSFGEYALNLIRYFVAYRGCSTSTDPALYTIIAAPAPRGGGLATSGVIEPKYAGRWFNDSSFFTEYYAAHNSHAYKHTCLCDQEVIMDIVAQDNPALVKAVIEPTILFKPGGSYNGVSGVFSQKYWKVDIKRYSPGFEAYNVFYWDNTDPEGGSCVGGLGRTFDQYPGIFTIPLPVGMFPLSVSGDTDIWGGTENWGWVYDSIKSAISAKSNVIKRSADNIIDGSHAVISAVGIPQRVLFGGPASTPTDAWIEFRCQVWNMQYDPAIMASPDAVDEMDVGTSLAHWHLWVVSRPDSYVQGTFINLPGLSLGVHATLFRVDPDYPYILGHKMTASWLPNEEFRSLDSWQEDFEEARTHELNTPPSYTCTAYEGVYPPSTQYLCVEGDPAPLGTDEGPGSIFEVSYRTTVDVCINGTTYAIDQLNGKFFDTLVDPPSFPSNGLIGTGDPAPSSVDTSVDSWETRYKNIDDLHELWIVVSPYIHSCIYNYHYILTDKGRLLPDGTFDPQRGRVVPPLALSEGLSIGIMDAGDYHWWEHGFNGPEALVGAHQKSWI